MSIAFSLCVYILRHMLAHVHANSIFMFFFGKGHIYVLYTSLSFWTSSQASAPVVIIIIPCKKDIII